eukprot:g33935.t1
MQLHQGGHFSASLYYKPTDNLIMLHFSRFHSKHIKEAIPYRQALCIHRTCSDEEESDRHLKVLKDTLLRTGYDAQLINRQFRHATAKNRNNILRRRAQDATERVCFVAQYFPERRNYGRFFAAFNMSSITMSISPRSSLHFDFSPSNNCQILNKLPSLQDNIDHNTYQPCNGNLCKTCQIINMDITITREDALMHGILARHADTTTTDEMATTQQSLDRNVPSQSGNTSAVKDIQPLIFSLKSDTVIFLEEPCADDTK